MGRTFIESFIDVGEELPGCRDDISRALILHASVHIFFDICRRRRWRPWA